MRVKRREGMTFVEVIISMLIFGIFILVLSSSISLIMRTMETQNLITDKLYTSSKLNFLIGIMEDEFKWLGSFGDRVAQIGGPFDITNDKGIRAEKTVQGDILFDYQYGVTESYILQNEGRHYKKVFETSTAPSTVNLSGGSYLAITTVRSGDTLIDVSTATLAQSELILGSSTQTLTIDASKVYFIKLRKADLPLSSGGKSDYYDQLIRGTFKYDKEKGAISLHRIKGFTGFSSTMTIIENVRDFEMSFYDGNDGSWKQIADTNFSAVKAIQATITVDIPASERLRQKYSEHKEYIQLTKNRIFWLPPE